MEIKNVYVNWVLDDEELLEPYEWKEDDDLEIISSINIVRVDSDTMYDLYYSQLVLDNVHDYKMVIFSNGINSIACEFDTEKKLKYRSLLMLEDRDTLFYRVKQLPVSDLLYTVYAYGEIKEFGLTRFEREKKQWILLELEELYQKDPNNLNTIAKDYLGIDDKQENDVFHKIVEVLDKGYTNIHEILYQQFVKEH